MKKYIKTVLTGILVMILLTPSTDAQTQKPWQWVNQIGGPGWDIASGIAIDKKNNVYIAGTFFNSLSVDKKSIVSNGDKDLFLARFDSNGNIEKLFGFGGKGNDQVSSICITPDRCIVLGGTISDSVSFGKTSVKGPGLFFSSIDADGKAIWTKTFKFSGNAAISYIQVDSTGNLYATGSFSDTLKYEDALVVSQGQKDIFLIKLSPKGSIDKLISLGGKGDDTPTAFSVSKGGDLLLSGNYSTEFKLDTLRFIGKQKANIFIVKLDNKQSPVWGKTFTGTNYAGISSILNEETGDIYLAGSFNQALSMEDTSLMADGLTDGFIVKLNQEGKRSWFRKIGSQYYDYITGLNKDNVGGIIATGSIGDTIWIDSLMIAPKLSSDVAVVIQLDSGGNLVWADYIEGSGSNYSYGSGIDTNGNLYFTGSFGKSFKKEDGSLTSFGDQDIFLARYRNCEEEEVKFTGSTAICPGESSEIGVSNSYKSIVWNDTVYNQSHLSVKKPGKYKVCIITKKGCKYDGNTELMLATKPSYSLGEDTSILAIDTLYLNAPAKMSSFQWMYGTLEPIYPAFSEKNKTGKKSYWVDYTDSLDCNWSDTIKVQFTEAKDLTSAMDANLVIYPNPVTDNLQWKLETSSTCHIVFEVTDNLGHRVYSQEIPYYEPGTEQRVPFSQYPIGTYVVNIRNNRTGEIYSSSSIIKR
jgi:hypothetical protein